MVIDLRRCNLAAGAAPFGCDWCGKPLRKGPERWCGASCRIEYDRHHTWEVARLTALRRDHFACVVCGRRTDVEVNHKVPLAHLHPNRSKRPHESCAHHQDNLETLCHAHHLEATAEQRASGLIPSRKKER